MLTYRTHVYRLVLAVSAEAMGFAMALSRCESALSMTTDDQQTIGEHLPSLRECASALRAAIDELRDALPEDAQEKALQPSRLLRHMAFAESYLNKGQPLNCIQDAIDMSTRDLSIFLGFFEEWYDNSSPRDEVLSSRVEPLLEIGQFNSANREAWVIFKKRMREMFNAPSDLDGAELAAYLFGNQGITTQVIDSKEREGYLNLFKGLYALNRNPVVHNDLDPNPEAIEAVISLANFAIVNLEKAYLDVIAD